MNTHKHSESERIRRDERKRSSQYSTKPSEPDRIQTVS